MSNEKDKKRKRVTPPDDNQQSSSPPSPSISVKSIVKKQKREEKDDDDSDVDEAPTEVKKPVITYVKPQARVERETVNEKVQQRIVAKKSSKVIDDSDNEDDDENDNNDDEDIDEEEDQETISDTKEVTTPPQLSKTTDGEQIMVEEVEEEEDDDEGLYFDDSDNEVEVKTGSTLRNIPPSLKKSTNGNTPVFDYAQYDAEKGASWKKGQKTPYLFLARVFDQISSITSRIKITELLTNCFRSIICLSPEDLLPSVYLCTNRIAAAHEGIELGVGDGILMKTLAEATGKDLKIIRKMYTDEGDLGSVARMARGTQKTMFQPKPLTIGGVYKDFRFIATSTGKNSQQKKADKIKALLVASKEMEPQYIVRSLQGKLRIGLGEETVLVSLAHAIVLTGVGRGETVPVSKRIRVEELKSAEETLKMVYSEMPWYDKILEELLARGFDNLTKVCKLTVGVPIRPMLAKAARGVQEIFERFGKQSFSCEYKYDGERQQIHIMENGTVKLYSRNLEDTTGKFPDVIGMIPSAMSPTTKSAILDCEVVAYDAAEKKIKPFQILSTRGRKNITVEDIKVPVCIFAFDLLYLNGESLLKKSLKERREKLYSSFVATDAKFQFAVHLDSNDTEEIQEFLTEAVKANCEGLIVKSYEQDASYEPSRRTFNWLKLKKDYIKGLGDSLDLVPIGGYKGKGKRTGVYGGFLLASYDPDTESYQSICKIGTGFSDENLKTLTQQLDAHKIDGPKSYYSYADAHEPDVWFDVKQVWEVLAADLTLSPTHTAGIGIIADDRGIALRFPRFIRVRTDKEPDEATTAEQVADMYRRQASLL